MTYSKIVSVLLILSILCHGKDILSNQCLKMTLETLQEIEEGIIEEGIRDEEDIETYILDNLYKYTETQGEEEEKGILKFNIDGLMLSEGIISEDVLRLKKFFLAKGYEGLVEDYYFDQKTKEAVIEYQRENGLVPDGIVGINTFTKINEDMELNKIIIEEIQLIFDMDKLDENSDIPEGNFIVINKDSNTLYHINNKEIVKKYPVATGKDPKYTPEGKFTIVTKFVNPAWGGAGRHTPIRGGAPNNPLGKRWMGLDIRGGGVYGIHGNSNENSIGRYVSLGCVRMFNEDVEILYDLIDYKTPVWIGSEEKLKEFGIIFGYK